MDRAAQPSGEACRMTARINISDGKLLLVGAAGIFILSCVWVGAGQEDIRRLRRPWVAFAGPGPAYHPGSWPRPDATVRDWPSPTAQSSGPGWNYEVFTPPVIYSNALATDFRVAAPARQGADSTRLNGELLAVKPEPYRLQLMGYVGRPGDYRAIFVRPGQPGTLLMREGQDLPDLGLTFLSLVVKNFSGDPAGRAPAQAILHDARSGENVVLECRSIRHTGVLLAVLRTAGERQPREWREGDAWTAGSVMYRVERIQLAPPEVIVTRRGPEHSRPERMELYPAHGDNHPVRKIVSASAITAGSTAAGLASDRD
jgi:hypothetical protein